MKKRIFCGIAALWMVASVAQTEMTGKQIMEDQRDRHRVKSEVSTNVMLLIDRRGRKEKRIMKWVGKDFGKGEHKVLLYFTAPADVKGTALLTWVYEDAADDQWLYLPAQKKTQRISQSSQRSYIMGTDFTYEDIQPEDVDDFTYTVLREEKFMDQDCWVVEAAPANEAKKKGSAYSKRLLWVRKDIVCTTKIEFYDQRGEHVKTQTIHLFENLEGTVWRGKKTLMDNHREKHKTLAGVTAREINVEVDDKVFTERYILSESHIK